MNVEDLMLGLVIVLLISSLVKIDIAEMMSMTWKELIFLAFVFIIVMYLPFPYGILIQAFFKGLELLVGYFAPRAAQSLSYYTGAFIAISLILEEGFRLLQRLYKILKQVFSNHSCANASSMPSMICIITLNFQLYVNTRKNL